MLDKNGIEMRTGDIVRISGAYFKNDNGLYVIDHAPGDPSWSGRDYGLKKILRNGNLSRAKYSTCFWPLKAFTNDRYKNACAKEHNAEHATIEVVYGIPKAGRIELFSEKMNDAKEAKVFAAFQFGEQEANRYGTIADHYRTVIDHVKAES